jgi:dipeptidyl aminopeptidase/acylaminoacyl peptidase
MTLKSCFILLLLLGNISNAQQLKLEEIMKGNAFIGEQPENHRWSLDGTTVYFEWNPKNEIETSTYFWKKGFSKPELASDTETQFSKLNFKKDKNGSFAYFIEKGTLYSYDLKNKTRKKLYQSTSGVSNLQLGFERGVLFFKQNNNLFKFNTLEGTIVQFTNFTKGINKEKKQEKNTFLTTQQKELFQFTKDDEAKKKLNLQKAKILKSEAPKALYYGNYNFNNLNSSPKGDFATFILTEDIDIKSEQMTIFITSDGYNQASDTKEKVSSTAFYESKLGIYNSAQDSTIYVDFSKLSNIQDQPKYFELYENLKNQEKVNRKIAIQTPIYNEDGSKAILSIRSQDNKDRWLVLLDLATGKFQEIENQRDDAWIGGPGIPSSNYGSGTLGFLNDNESIYFQSEATGFSHLYTYNLTTKTKKQLTSGNWEVRNVDLSNDKKTFYLTTNTTHLGNRNYYKLNVSDGKLEPILTKDGAHEVILSPDESKLLIRYSYKNKPWELFVADNKKNTIPEQITYSTSESFQKYNWRSPEVISFKAQDGTNINARIYQPTKEKANKAAILFVHGAGYLQNAHNFWSTYHREYMFHNLLSDLGYTVLDIDYRASDGYGRDFRTGIYRFMGGKDLLDQIDGKQYLVEHLGIDPEKVGIYGGSYGGFITLMALMTAPNTFACGAALRSVTDWAHYNNGYTGNILNFPETDPDAYKKSSPIYHAEKLEGNLLMLHGMIDDNVEYKDIIRLSQRLIELGKKNWNLASYPVESHGFKTTSSWIDEYSRILNLFDSTLLKK